MSFNFTMAGEKPASKPFKAGFKAGFKGKRPHPTNEDPSKKGELLPSCHLHHLGLMMI